MATRVAGRRVTRLRAVGALLVVLVVLGVGGAASTAAFNQLNGPEQAVLDYAALLADGRASAAARRVPPDAGAGRTGVVVPALVSDTALARATTRLRPLSAAVETGLPGGADVPVGQVVTVDLTYGLGSQSGVAPLRVRRDADGFPFAHKWTVLTPLLVPVVVQSNVPSLGAPSLAGVSLPLASAAGSGSVSASGTGTGSASGTGTGSASGTGTGSAQPVLVYPGVYPLTTPSYPLLVAGVGSGPPTLVAVHAADASVHRQALVVPLTWTGSTDLQAQIASGVVSRLTTCVTQGVRMDVNSCPASLYAQRSRPGLTSNVTPTGLVLGDVSRGTDGFVEVAFTYSTPASVLWTGRPPGRIDIPITGTIAFMPNDRLAVPVLDILEP